MKKMSKRSQAERPVTGKVCNRCHRRRRDGGYCRCGCPEYSLERDSQGRLFR